MHEYVKNSVKIRVIYNKYRYVVILEAILEWFIYMEGDNTRMFTDSKYIVGNT